MSSTLTTSKSIKAIDANSVHQITSGQVVIDLQTAVKELVENSLDAGATSLEIRFKNYGLRSIEVVDNGSGIPETDFEDIGRKHHTSKLSSFEDLSSITSFGFRGEAMSSLCALCESVTVTTAVAEKAPMGTVLELGKGGQVLKKGMAPRQRGTTVMITTPFVSLPVRRKELERNIKREFGKALALLNAYALGPCCGLNANPNHKDPRVRAVRFVVTNQPDKGQRTSHISLPLPPTSVQPSVRNGVAVLWGNKALDNVVDFQFEFQVPRISLKKPKKKEQDEEEDGMFRIHVKGIISSPVVTPGSSSSSRFARTSADRQFFYVNGRPCILTKIQKVINETYRSFTASNSAIPHFPMVIADFSLPGDAVDINVTPDKRTILVHAETQVIDGLKTALEDLFSPTRSTFNLNGAQRSNSLDIQQASQIPPAVHVPSGAPSVHSDDSRVSHIPYDAPPLRPRRMSVDSDGHAEDVSSTRSSSGVQKESMQAGSTLGLRRESIPSRAKRLSDPTSGLLPLHSDTSPKMCTADPSTIQPVSPSLPPITIADAPASPPQSEIPAPPVSPLAVARRQISDVPEENGKEKVVVVSTTRASWTQQVNDMSTGSSVESDELDDDDEDGPPRKKRKSSMVSDNNPLISVFKQPTIAKDEGSSSKSARGADPPRQLKLTDAFKPRSSRQNMRSRLAGFARSGSQIPAAVDNDTEAQSDEIEEVDATEKDAMDLAEDETGPPVASKIPLPLFLPDDDGDTTMEDDTSSSVAPATISSSTSTTNPPTSSSVLPPSSDIIDLTPDGDDEIDDSLMSSMNASQRELEPIDRPEVIRTSSQTSGDVHLRFDVSQLTERWAQLRGKLKTTRKSFELPNDNSPVLTPSSMDDDELTTDQCKSAEAKLSRVIDKEDFGRMEVLGQFNLGFIIVRKRSREQSNIISEDLHDDLFIVDQHAADEKYNFETLQHTCTIKSQKLIRPISLDLTASDEILASENLDVLMRNGFEVQLRDDDCGVDASDGGGDAGRSGSRLRLAALPISKGTVFDMKDLEELIHLLNDTPSGQMVRCSKARAMFASRACRKSVMVGMPLTRGQMTTVVHHMGTMEEPWNCPHGRPTMRHLYDMSNSRSRRKLRPSRVDWASFT